MRPRHVIGFAGLGALALAVASLWWWRREAAAALGAERDALRDQTRELAQVRAEHQRLEAARIPEEKLAALRADHAAVERLRDEIDAVKKQMGASQAAVTAKSGPTSIVPAADWRNAGRGTPGEAVETALWAAATGNLDAFAASVTFDAANRAAVDELFSRLTPELHAQYRTPERLVATFATKAIPLGSMRIFGEREDHPGEAVLGVMLQPPNDGKGKPTLLNLRKADGGWRLLVPMAALQNYVHAIGASGFVPR